MNPSQASIRQHRRSKTPIEIGSGLKPLLPLSSSALWPLARSKTLAKNRSLVANPFKLTLVPDAVVAPDPLRSKTVFSSGYAFVDDDELGDCRSEPESSGGDDGEDNAAVAAEAGSNFSSDDDDSTASDASASRLAARRAVRVGADGFVLFLYPEGRRRARRACVTCWSAPMSSSASISGQRSGQYNAVVNALRVAGRQPTKRTALANVDIGAPPARVRVR